MLFISHFQKNARPASVQRSVTNRDQRWVLAGKEGREASALSSGSFTLGIGLMPTSNVAYTSVLGPLFSSTPWVYQQLVSQWRVERGAESSTTKIVTCPSYLRIIGLGPEVIPLILRQLESEGDDPDHWFSALKVLTNSDPVPAEDRGDMVRMAQAWLDWGRLRYAW